MKSSVTSRAFFSIHTHQIVACTVLMLAITGATMSARANLLVDPGFEANPLTTAYNVLNFFPTYQGQWGQENSTITGVDNGVTPVQGVKMLRMVDDGLTATQGFQVTDVTSYAAFIDSGGATVNMIAMFNVDKGVPAALGAVYVQFFSAANYGSQIGIPIANNLALDNSDSTWETDSVSGAIPVGTRWLLSQVLYNNASLLGVDGVTHPGYVDAADLRIVPEPSTLVLLGTGLLGLLAYAWRKRASTVVSAMLVVLLFAAEASAVQYPVLDPGYTQEIYTGPLQGGEGGMAWTSSGNFLTRKGSDIIEHSLTQNVSYQSTNLHGVIGTHNIPGLPSSGVGMTNGLDGYVYTITGSGLYRFNPSNWAAPAQFLTGTISGAQGYGITTLPDGRIAYTDSAGSSSVWLYTPNVNPLSGTNTLLTTLPGVLVDGMIAGPTGAIALAGQSNSSIVIIDNLGSIINSFSTPHYPDGLAFSGVVASSTLYSNNNDGTISKYVMGPGYTGTPTITDIAGVSGAYGDLAGVGPDCGFYVSQYSHPIAGYHGSVPGVGTNWDSNTTTAEASIIRIGTLGHNGTPGEICEFYTPLGTSVPEPSTLVLLGIGAISLLAYAWHRRRS